MNKIIIILTLLSPLQLTGKSNSLKTDNSINRSNTKLYVWVDPMIGGINYNLTVGIKLNLSYCLLFSLEYISSEELCFSCDESETNQQFNFLFEKLYNYRFLYLFGQFGLGYNSGQKHIEPYDDGITIRERTKKYNSYGISLQSGIFLAKKIGIGLIIHVNLNTSNSQIGVLLNFPFGYNI